MSRRKGGGTLAKVQWTPQQRSAIEDQGGALLVSAAAGSGKTAVLVERAVRMITRAENPVAADRLLILTFTNAAAEELRVRIGVRVEEEIRQRPGEVPLRRQRMLLRRAFIGTIDAFCQQLVKENFARLDLPPDIAIGDPSLLAQLSAQALADTMEEMYAGEDFVQFASLYGQARSDRPTEDAILTLHEFAMTLPAPAAQLARWAEMYDNDAPLADTRWGEELLAYARQGAEAMAETLRQAAAIAGAEPALAPYLPALLEEQGAAARLAEVAARGSWDEAVRALQAVQFGRLAPVRGYDGPEKDQVKMLRESAKDIADRLGRYCLACTEAEYETDRRQAAPLVGALCRAAALYEEKYRAAKLEEKVLDFADFEQLALALLRDEAGSRTPAAARVSGRYDAVMVDEYQDTNELQSALYESLAREDGSNLFYVGDVKQSIYRFRKADPGIFLAKKDVWAAYDAGNYPAALELAHNFRSGSGVVAGVNYLFSVLMSRQMGEVEYGAGERLIQGSEGGEEEGLELRIVQDPEGLGDAEYVAERIRRMLEEGYTVRGKEGPRRCGAGDFCILLRARARVPQYVQALAARGIPVAAVGDDLLQTPEVLPVVAALAVIDNPGDDVMLASALLGPLFGFTADEVTALRARMPRGSLWGAVSASEEEKAKGFVQTIGFYRALAGEMSAGRLCEELLSRTGYLSAVAAMEGGGARRENLLRFLAWIGEVSAVGRGGLSGVVRLLQEGRGPAAPAAAAVPGRVNILTIHKSKGLEFPVCFLADAAHVFNTSDLTARVQLHQKLGVGLALRAGHTLYATAPALAVRRRIEREALSEEMRVLYVALTRAKEKVIVTFARKDPGRYLAGKAAALCGAALGAYLLGSQRSLADWVTLAALCHPDAGPLLCHCGGAMLPMLPAEGRFVMGVEEQPQAAAATEERYELTAAPDEALAKEIADGFGRGFARAALAAVPVKMSVSEMAKPTATPVRRRPSILYAAGLTAAERGTAQHAFMQYAEPKAAANDLEAEIERLVAGGYLRPEAAAALDRAGIRAFLASPLAGRVEQAAEVLREYDFITAVPAGRVQPELPAALAGESVMVQGIADMVLVYGDHAEIADYKTDHGKSVQKLAAQYAAQLHLYKDAIEKRLPVPVTRLTIWAFELAEEVDVPLTNPMADDILGKQ